MKDGFPGGEDLSIGVTLLTESDCTQFSQGLQLTQGQDEAWTMASYKAGTRFSIELSAAASSTMEKELEAIQELHSVEPENKCRSMFADLMLSWFISYQKEVFLLID